MENSARMDDAEFGSLPPWKSNDVKVTIIQEIASNSIFKKQLIVLSYFGLSVLDMDAASDAS